MAKKETDHALIEDALATRVLKTVLWILGSVGSVIILITGFFGYKATTDFNNFTETLKSKKQELVHMTDSLENQIEIIMQRQAQRFETEIVELESLKTAMTANLEVIKATSKRQDELFRQQIKQLVDVGSLTANTEALGTAVNNQKNEVSKQINEVDNARLELQKALDTLDMKLDTLDQRMKCEWRVFTDDKPIIFPSHDILFKANITFNNRNGIVNEVKINGINYDISLRVGDQARFSIGDSQYEISVTMVSNIRLPDHDIAGIEICQIL